MSQLRVPAQVRTASLGVLRWTQPSSAVYRPLHVCAIARAEEASEVAADDKTPPVKPLKKVVNEIVEEHGVDLSLVGEGDGDRAYDPEVLELADRVLRLNMLQAVDLMDVLREKLGKPDDPADLYVPMSAIGGMAMAAPAGGGGGGAAAEEAAPVEEKTAFDVVLKGFDAKSKIKVIKEVRAISGLGLKEAKALVESAPAPVSKGIKKEEAEEIMNKLKEIGAEVELE